MSVFTKEQQAQLDGLAGSKTTATGRDSTHSRVAAFARQVAPIAERVGAAIGVDPAVLTGQWGLETRWGQSIVAGHNLGNVKVFRGPGVTARDNATGSIDQYRTFTSPEDFANHFTGLVSRKYSNATGTGSDAKAYGAALRRGGYAEDPSYAAKIASATSMVRKALGNEVASPIPTRTPRSTKPTQSDKGNSMPTRPEPGTFQWQNDPNFRGPTNSPQQTPQASQPVQTKAGSATRAAANVMSAAQQLRGGAASKQGGGLIKKIAPAITDGIGQVVGKIDEGSGRQIEARADGLRMRSDTTQAKQAADAYGQAAKDATDPELAQQYRDVSANLSRGAGIAESAGAEGASTMAGTIAEGASKLLPIVGVSALGQFADGGKVEDQGAEFSRAWHAQDDTEQPAQTIRRFSRRAKKRHAG